MIVTTGTFSAQPSIIITPSGSERPHSSAWPNLLLSDSTKEATGPYKHTHTILSTCQSSSTAAGTCLALKSSFQKHPRPALAVHAAAPSDPACAHVHAWSATYTMNGFQAALHIYLSAECFCIASIRHVCILPSSLFVLFPYAVHPRAKLGNSTLLCGSVSRCNEPASSTREGSYVSLLGGAGQEQSPLYCLQG